MSILATLLLLYTLTVRPSPVPEHSPATQPQRTLDEPPERHRCDCQSQPVRVVAVGHGAGSTDGQSRYIAAHIREIDSCAVIASKTIWCAVGLIDSAFSAEVLSVHTSNGFPDAARQVPMVSAAGVRDGLGYDAESAPALRIGLLTHRGKPAFRGMCGLTESARKVNIHSSQQTTLQHTREQ